VGQGVSGLSQDVKIRKLERLAAQGDTDAHAAVRRERCRAGHCECGVALAAVVSVEQIVFIDNWTQELRHRAEVVLNVDAMSQDALLGALQMIRRRLSSG